jgi:hypothetical protein
VDFVNVGLFWSEMQMVKYFSPDSTQQTVINNVIDDSMKITGKVSLALRVF